MTIDLRRFFAIAVVFIVSAGFSIAQTEPAQTGPAKSSEQGQVRVTVFPEEAYIFVDGKPMAHRNSTLKLTPGEYTITVANYGYAPQTQKVTVTAGERKEMNARLSPSGDRVSGPRGRIQIEGAPGGAAIFLNGTTPAFFVGHADEMNNNVWNVQQLIVPPGKHQLYVIDPGTDKTLFSGPVDVRPNERLIVHLKGDNQAEMEYKGWPEAAGIKDLKRFEASTATATIAVAPVTATLAAEKPVVHCNENGKLTWSSANAGETTLTTPPDQKLADSASGSLEVQPKRTTKYELRAVGPGGVLTKDVTINVDPTVQTSLTPSTVDLRYVKVGDTVQEQGSTNLNWTAAHADSVKIEPIGPVSGNSGSQTVRPQPKASVTGPVDEMVTYRITGTNQCGGSDTSTASIHLTGSVAPAPAPKPAVAEAKPPELPHTASPLPLLALLGLASLAAGSLLRLRTRR